MHSQKYPRTQDLGAALPAEVQWKADNYNHLMEQPTIFHATVFMLVLIGEGSGRPTAARFDLPIMSRAEPSPTGQ